jgi:hypothetical protein
VTALSEALKHHSDVVNFIIRRSNIGMDVMPALLAACESGELEVVKGLIPRLPASGRDQGWRNVLRAFPDRRGFLLQREIGWSSNRGTSR